MAKRKEGSDALGIVVAIADKDSLRIMGDAPAAGRSLIFLVVVVVLELHDRSRAGILLRRIRGNIFEAPGKCDGQLGGGVEVSPKYLGDGISIFLSWVPGL